MKVLKDQTASANPVMILIIALGVASFLILLFGHIIEPFLQLLGFTDSTLNPAITAPRELMFELSQIIWPKGILIVILVGLIVAMLMEYQKIKYREG